MAAAALAATPVELAAQTLRLKDGRLVYGAVAVTAGVAESPHVPSQGPGEIAVQSIYLIDDDLRRTFIAKRQVAEVLDQAPRQQVTINIWQDVATAGGYVSAVGPSLGVTPFDEFGRRIYEMQTKTGPQAVIQGVTKITPWYAKVEALRGSRPRTVVWDMRLATSSIPQATLAKIFARNVPRDDVEARLQVVRFYIDAERYSHARRELQNVIADFPEMKELDAQVKELRQMGARRILREIRMRRSAGQHKLVEVLLDNFPTDGVPGETLAEVRELTAETQRVASRVAEIKSRLAQLVESAGDPDQRGLASPLAAEIQAELSPNNLERLTAFAQLIDDKSLGDEQKLALALSGWLLGADGAQDDFAVAIGLVKLRTAVTRYLREPLAAERAAVLDEVETLAGASVENAARLVANMKPPQHRAEYTDDSTGAFTLTAPGVTEDGDFVYHVQLPPEYDPYRRYPTLLTLHGAYNSPKLELDFWAGAAPPPAASDGAADANEAPPAERRTGQAGRHGYITIAVDWMKPQQYEYEHSAREHISVLTCLRDATRRFSVDADRVYLSGHGVGGDAAWDLAQAHPDLWAGVIPFTARAAKYVRHYWENAKYVPWYFVAGEKDGQNVDQNAALWNKYIKKIGYDATLIEYQGRGHEPFHDEILHAFDWMGRRRRDGPPEEFACQTMRPWDNFFWWVECRDFNDKWMVHPAEWKQRRTKNAQVEGKLRAGNRLLVKTVANFATIWLNPDLVDFSRPISVTVNGRSKVQQPPGGVQPTIGVLLEDVRTRGDRQRPFWAKLEWPS